jgi:basic membrane protein A and related proteins
MPAASRVTTDVRSLWAALLAGLLVGCGTASAPAGPVAHRQPLICLVTSAGPTTQAFNQLAQAGVAAAHVESHIIESPGPTWYAANLERCAASAPDLTVGLSTGMASATWQVARQHPTERFALVDAVPIDTDGKTAPLSNVADLLFNEQEAGYLVGVLSGLMETMKVGTAVHNRIGGLGMTQVAASQRYLAGFIAGARSVDPNVGVRLDWTPQADQAGCKTIGAAQVTTQVDILFQAAGPCGPGYIEAAYDGHAYAIGSDADQATLSPAVITSAVKRVDRALQLTLQRLAAGIFTPGPQYFGLADDATGFAQPSSVVPQTILIQLGTVRAAIVSGAVTPPAIIPAGL